MTRIQIKRGTAAAWTSANPILSPGEMGYETDTKKIKVGDGTTPWSSLVYSYFGVGSYTQAIGNGSATTITVTHNLNTRNVVVSVKEAATYTEVLCDVTAVSANAVTLTFATAPSAGQYIVTVLGDNVPVQSISSTSPFLDSNFTLREATDNTKQAQFSASAITTGTTRTFTLPDANTALVGTDTAQILTNKTITSPAGLVKGDVGLGNVDNTSDASKNAAVATLTNKTLTAPKIDSIKDPNGNTNIQIGAVGSAVNYLQVNNAATGNAVGLYASGTDTNIGLDLNPKGSGSLTWAGVSLVSTTATQILTNKTLTSPVINSATGSFTGRITPRIGTTASSATPSIDITAYDQYNITALAVAITSVTVTGTPTDGQKLLVRIKDDGTARAISWGSSFLASGSSPLLTTTVATKTHLSGFIYDAVAAKWICVAADAAGY